MRRIFLFSLLTLGGCCTLTPPEASAPDNAPKAKHETSTAEIAASPLPESPPASSELPPAELPSADPAELPPAGQPPSAGPAGPPSAGPGPGRRGQATFYGLTSKFQGRRTASGERFDAKKFTSASNHFPLGVWLAVSRLDKNGVPDGRCVLVKNNDRMRRHRTRIVDLSLAAAKSIGMIRAGVVDVEIRQLPASPADRTVATCRAAFADLE